MLVNSKGSHLTIQKKSKWTWEAVDFEGKTVTTDKSKKKLMEKLNATPCSKSTEINVSPSVTKSAKKIKKRKARKNLASFLEFPEEDNVISTSSCKAKPSDKTETSPFKSEKDKKSKGQSMRNATLQMILDGRDDAFILDSIKVTHPGAKYNLSHVQWYRSNFAKSELITAEFAPKRSSIYKEWKLKQ